MLPLFSRGLVIFDAVGTPGIFHRMLPRYMHSKGVPTMKGFGTVLATLPLKLLGNSLGFGRAFDMSQVFFQTLLGEEPFAVRTLV